MAEKRAMPVAEPLGWQMTDDKKHALVSFRLADASEHAIAVDADALRKMLLCFIDATAAFPLDKTLGKKQAIVLSTNWFEFGRVTGTPDYYLTFFRESGAHLSFRIDLVMAQKIRETLNASLPDASAPVPTPDRRQ